MQGPRGTEPGAEAPVRSWAAAQSTREASHDAVAR